jgi:hypothetical protein
MKERDREGVAAETHHPSLLPLLLCLPLASLPSNLYDPPTQHPSPHTIRTHTQFKGASENDEADNPYHAAGPLVPGASHIRERKETYS